MSAFVSIEVWVDGKALPQAVAPSGNSYIVAQPGKPYTIVVMNKSSQNLGVKVYADSLQVRFCWLHPTGPCNTATVPDVVVSAVKNEAGEVVETRAKLVFAEVAVVRNRLPCYHAFPALRLKVSSYLQVSSAINPFPLVCPPQ
jgi:hypothetical protein